MSKWVSGQKVCLKSKSRSQVKKWVSGNKWVSGKKVGHRTKLGLRLEVGLRSKREFLV